jgi:hypothetical protein
MHYETAPNTHYVAGRVSPQPVSMFYGENNFLFFLGIEPSPPPFILQPSHYTNCAILVHT